MSVKEQHQLGAVDGSGRYGPGTLSTCLADCEAETPNGCAAPGCDGLGPRAGEERQ